MHTLDATRVVRSVTEKTLSVRNPAGRNSSILRANGFITKEYLQAVKDEAIPLRRQTISETQRSPKTLKFLK